MSTIVRLILIGAVSLLLVNCVAVQPFPTAARAGDTITLAVGTFEGMTKSNTTVEYVSDEGPTAGNTYDLTANMRAITNIYPDKTSHAWSSNNNADGLAGATGHGQWQTIIILDLATNLPNGLGHINVQTTADPDAMWFVLADVNNVQLPMEILPGPGVNNDFSYYGGFLSLNTGDLSLLEQRKQAVVKFLPDPGSSAMYGASQITVNVSVVDSSSGLPIPDHQIQVIPGEFKSNVVSQRQQSWSKVGSEITAYTISPVGMHARESRFSIVIPDTAEFSVTPTISQFDYYDLDGNSIAGPTPTIAIVQ